MSWRVFIGDPVVPPEFSFVDATVEDFDVARVMVIEALAKFIAPDCEDCRRDGTQAALDVLRMEGPPGVWEDEVDGHVYRIEDLS